MKAIVCGGGIGGLTAALSFHHNGWDVQVLEKSPALGEVGAGIQISPNAMKVLSALELGLAESPAAFRPEAIELRDGLTGARLIRTPLGQVAAQRWGAPYLHIHRADLVDHLHDALSERAPGSLQLGCTVESYEQDEGGVAVKLSDGRRVRGDILVGADGIHSVIRRQMLGPGRPVFTGNVAWRATVPVERLGAIVPSPVACAWLGAGQHAVTYLLRGGELANLVAVVERGDWTKESWSEPGRKEDALADFAGWHPTITRLLEESDALFRWALFDRPPLARWCDGRVAILGDAAHPMLPFMAQGAAMSIEDAWAMASLATSSSTIADGLRTYQSLRRDRTARVQAASRSNARTFHARTALERLREQGPIRLAGSLAPGIGLMRHDWLYGYDVVSETAARAHRQATSQV